MPSNSLEILEKGLTTLKNWVEARWKDLTAWLGHKEMLTDGEERWLDNEGNTVDEEKLVDKLRDAASYKDALQRLSVMEKETVKKLRELAGADLKPAGNKRKRPENVKRPEKSKPQDPVFTKKENSTLAQRIEILDWFHGNGRNQSQTALYFDRLYPNLRIKQPLVSRWVKNEARIRAQYEQDSINASRSKRICQTQHPEVTEITSKASKGMAKPDPQMAKL
ncbi:hypothetical protein C8R42DRAFT_724670 [Lentinula raphanica]|nr:hypothetical protein C8R42DRAFT_724670 [Lentinula raphanica]